MIDNEVIKLYLRNHRKILKPWLNFDEDKKLEVRRKFRTLGDFLKSWKPDLSSVVRLEHNFKKVFWESFLLQS